MTYRNISIKSLALLLIGVLALLLPSNSYAEYQTIYKAPVESMTLAPGVVFEKHRILTPEGWIDAQVIRSNTNPADTLVPIYPSELYRRTVLSKLFDDSEQRLVAAINGDFSDFNSYAALGQMFKQGELLQTSNDLKEMAHVKISRNGTVEMGYQGLMNHIGTIGAEDFKISYINKEYYYKDRILLFDAKYAKESPAVTDLAVLIRNGVVSEVKEKTGVFDLEEGDMVLHCSGKDAKRLKAAAVKGAEFRLKLDPALKDVYTSFSGGSIIVKDGKSVDFTHNILGHHPRTAMGITKDGDTVLLVTVSGRSVSYRGMRQSELAEFMIQLGAHQAINLDGGGSTEMVYRDPYTNNKVIPGYLSDGTERRLYNGIGIVYEGTPSGEMGGIRFLTTEISALQGIPVDLKLQAYDTAYFPCPLDGDQPIIFDIKGIKGRFENRTFIPESEGSGTIIATLGEHRAYMNVEVEANPTQLLVYQNETNFRFALRTETGAEVVIPSYRVSAYISDGFGKYDPETGRITPNKENGVGYVTFTYYLNDKDILSESLPLSSGKRRDLLYDFDKGIAGLKVLPAGLEATFVEAAYDDPEQKVGILHYKMTLPKDNKIPASKDKDANKQISKTRAAYIDLGKMEIPQSADAISLRVYGSGADEAWMRMMLKTEDDKIHYLDIARNVNWEGWKTIEVSLPKSNGKRYLERVYVVEVDENIHPEGFVLVDHIEALTPLAYDGFMPLSFRREKQTEDYTIQGAPGISISYVKVEDFSDAMLQSLARDDEGKVKKEALKEKLKEWEDERDGNAADQFTFVRVHNRKGLIRSDSKAWEAIFHATTMPKKPILIQFTDQRVFKDNLEWELLLEKLKFSGKHAILVFDAQPGLGDLKLLDRNAEAGSEVDSEAGSEDDALAKTDEKLKSTVMMRKGVTIIELFADEEIEVNAKCEFVIRKKK